MPVRLDELEKRITDLISRGADPQQVSRVIKKNYGRDPFKASEEATKRAGKLIDKGTEASGSTLENLTVGQSLAPQTNILNRYAQQEQKRKERDRFEKRPISRGVNKFITEAARSGGLGPLPQLAPRITGGLASGLTTTMVEDPLRWGIGGAGTLTTMGISPFVNIAQGEGLEGTTQDINEVMDFYFRPEEKEALLDKGRPVTVTDRYGNEMTVNVPTKLMGIAAKRGIQGGLAASAPLGITTGFGGIPATPAGMIQGSAEGLLGSLAQDKPTLRSVIMSTLLGTGVGGVSSRLAAGSGVVTQSNASKIFLNEAEQLDDVAFRQLSKEVLDLSDDQAAKLGKNQLMDRLDEVSKTKGFLNKLRNKASDMAAEDAVNATPSAYRKAANQGIDLTKTFKRYGLEGDIDDWIGPVSQRGYGGQVGDEIAQSESKIASTLADDAGRKFDYDPIINRLKQAREDLAPSGVVTPERSMEIQRLDEIIEGYERLNRAGGKLSPAEVRDLLKSANKKFGQTIADETTGAVDTQVKKIVANTWRDELKKTYPKVANELAKEQELILLREVLRHGRGKQGVQGFRGLSRVDLSRPGSFLREFVRGPRGSSKAASALGEGGKYIDLPAGASVTIPTATRGNNFVSGVAPIVGGQIGMTLDDVIRKAQQQRGGTTQQPSGMTRDNRITNQMVQQGQLPGGQAEIYPQGTQAGGTAQPPGSKPFGGLPKSQVLQLAVSQGASSSDLNTIESIYDARAEEMEEAEGSEDLPKAQLISRQLDEIESNFENILSGRIGGRVERVKSAFGDPDLRNLKQNITIAAPVIGKNLLELGRLTDEDVQLAMSTLPDETSTPREIEYFISNMRSILASRYPEVYNQSDQQAQQQGVPTSPAGMLGQ